ncbi:MAG: tRNA (adenosine(37)-N6)-dimethylallyltransferase MiaA [Clostridia bacterium]|nr:tRNA (adenosine(37)-N6)-dimethylallyltransferase MiaA [Clostridia bacterium]
MKKKIICIVGPTASGKTGLSIELAKRIDAEIISADSMQIYKGLDIGTAKVTKEEMQGIKHHLIDICEITDKFSVADFKSICYDKINEILSRNKNVIICGGTGLYISAIVDDMNFDEEEVDIEYRKYLENLAKENSNEYVHDLLKKIDPVSASEIHPNNLKRVIRALEFVRNSDKLKSTHMREEKERILSKSSKYEFLIYYINHDREYLYERINKRVDMMIKDGVVEEALKVYHMNLGKDNTCMQAIGYKEFFPYFKGEDTLDNCILKLKQETRRYAKRQITWFKNKLDVCYLDGKKDTNELVNDIIESANY